MTTTSSANDSVLCTTCASGVLQELSFCAMHIFNDLGVASHFDIPTSELRHFIFGCLASIRFSPPCPAFV